MKFSNSPTALQPLIKEKSDAFERMMAERHADAIIEPPQPRVDLADIMQAVLAADDGKMPAERSRHNMTDPSALEVLEFCVQYMDDTDDKISKMQEVIRWMLHSGAFSNSLGSCKIYELLESLNDKKA